MTAFTVVQVEFAAEAAPTDGVSVISKFMKIPEWVGLARA
jgi:hypothetical protein